MALSSVLLPQPLGPTSAARDPRCSEKTTSLSTGCSAREYPMVTWDTSSDCDRLSGVSPINCLGKAVRNCVLRQWSDHARVTQQNEKRGHNETG